MQLHATDLIEMPALQGRYWVLTINNPPITAEELIVKFNTEKIKYTFQLESGENGTPHFQVFMCFSKRTTFSGIRRVFHQLAPHIERCRDPRASEAYCRKPESRVDGMYQYFMFISNACTYHCSAAAEIVI